MSRNCLTSCEELHKGDFLMSTNEKYKAIFQHDGNFVIYTWQPIWASDTWGIQDAERLVMQEDCNFVMYKKDGKPCWNTATHTSCLCSHNRIVLHDDGVLQIDRNGTEVWNSNQSKGCK